MHGSISAHCHSAPARGRAQVDVDVVVDEDNHLFRAGKSVVHEGQVITLNDATGEVIVGALPLVDPELSGDFRQLLDWARQVATTKVRTPFERTRYGSTDGGMGSVVGVFHPAKALPSIDVI